MEAPRPECVPVYPPEYGVGIASDVDITFSLVHRRLAVPEVEMANEHATMYLSATLDPLRQAGPLCHQWAASGAEQEGDNAIAYVTRSARLAGCFGVPEDAVEPVLVCSYAGPRLTEDGVWAQSPGGAVLFHLAPMLAALDANTSHTFESDAPELEADAMLAVEAGKRIRTGACMMQVHSARISERMRAVCERISKRLRIDGGRLQGGQLPPPGPLAVRDDDAQHWKTTLPLVAHVRPAVLIRGAPGVSDAATKRRAARLGTAEEGRNRYVAQHGRDDNARVSPGCADLPSLAAYRDGLVVDEALQRWGDVSEVRVLPYGEALVGLSHASECLAMLDREAGAVVEWLPRVGMDPAMNEYVADAFNGGIRMDVCPTDTGDVATSVLCQGSLPPVDVGALVAQSQHAARRLRLPADVAGNTTGLSVEQRVCLAAQTICGVAQYSPYILDTVSKARFRGNPIDDPGRDPCENVRRGPGDCEDGTAWILALWRSCCHRMRSSQHHQWRAKLQRAHAQLYDGLMRLCEEHVGTVAFCAVSGAAAGDAHDGADDEEEEEEGEGEAGMRDAQGRTPENDRERGGHATLLLVPKAWWWAAVRRGEAATDDMHMDAVLRACMDKLDHEHDAQGLRPIHTGVHTDVAMLGRKPDGVEQAVGAGRVLMLESTGALVVGSSGYGPHQQLHDRIMDAIMDTCPALAGCNYDLRSEWDSTDSRRHVHFFQTVTRLVTTYHLELGGTADTFALMRPATATERSQLPSLRWVLGSRIDDVLRSGQAAARLTDAERRERPVWQRGPREAEPVPLFALKAAPAATLLVRAQTSTMAARCVPLPPLTDRRMGRSGDRDEVQLAANVRLSNIVGRVNAALRASGAYADEQEVRVPLHITFYVQGSAVVVPSGNVPHTWAEAPSWDVDQCAASIAALPLLASVSMMRMDTGTGPLNAGQAFCVHLCFDALRRE